MQSLLIKFHSVSGMSDGGGFRQVAFLFDFKRTRRHDRLNSTKSAGISVKFH